MSNNVQLHESAAERAPGEERRASVRHAASSLGPLSARIIGGSPVDLVNFSSRGVLFECDSRLLIGARASVRITTADANLIVTGRVVRSRVKGLVNGALRYDAALALDTDLALLPEPAAALPAEESLEPESDDVLFESELDGVFDPTPVEAYLAESEASLAEVARAVAPEPVSTPEPSPVPAESAVDADDEPLEFEAVAEIEEPPMFEAAHAFEEPPMFEAAEAFDQMTVELGPAVEAPAQAEPQAEAVEPVAFESDAEIAFEAVDDFEFEPAADPEFEPAADPEMSRAYGDVAALVVEAHADAPVAEAASMFDARPYVVPPVEGPPARASMFEVTPPAPAYHATSSTFDARPSQTYIDGPVAELTSTEYDQRDQADIPAIMASVEIAVVETAGATTGESEPIDFESEVAFEAAEGMFEAASDVNARAAVVVESDADEPVVEIEAEARVAAAIDGLEPIEAMESIEAMDADAPLEPAEDAVDGSADLALRTAEADDRVMLQFAATVPHDLAELRRIAADNQW